MDKNTLIEIKGLGKTFNGTCHLKALSDVNLAVKEGEFISIVGPSGCGKTTLLRIIAGLEPYSEGEIRFKNNASDNRKNSGFVFQDSNLLPWRTAIENTVLALELSGENPDLYHKKARNALSLVNLTGFEDFYPKDLSGGMRQRVAIARSLVHDPVVLLMDEPFSALDEITRTKMSFELLRIWKETKKTIVYVTHDIDEAVLLSNRVVVMSQSPGTIKKIIDINLPKERDITTKDTEQFIHYRRDVREALHANDKLKHSDMITPKSKKNAFSFMNALKSYSMYAAVFIFFILLWKVFIGLFEIPQFLVPAPEDVFWEYLSILKSGILMKHTFVTLNETILGFVLGSVLGILIGYPLAKSKKLERILSPYAVAAQTAPKIAIAPLIVIWFGFGITSKVVLVMMIVFFPILINTMLGIKTVDKNRIELFKSTNASRLQTFTKLELPSALPLIFAGLKTSITLAVIGAVIGEFVGANAGLGYMTMYASGILDTPQVFAAIIQLTILGIILYGIISLIEERLMPWHKPEDDRS